MSRSWGHNGGKIQRHNANNSETIVCGNVRSSAPSTCANMLFQCLSNTASSGNRYSENVPHCSNGKIRNLPFLGPVEYEFVALRGIHCAEVTRGFDTTDLQDTAVYVVKLDPRSLHTQVHVWWLSTAWPYSNADDVHISRSATGGGGNRATSPLKFSKTCSVVRYNMLHFAPTLKTAQQYVTIPQPLPPKISAGCGPAHHQKCFQHQTIPSHHSHVHVRAFVSRETIAMRVWLSAATLDTALRFFHFGRQPRFECAVCKRSPSQSARKVVGNEYKKAGDVHGIGTLRVRTKIVHENEQIPFCARRNDPGKE